MRGSVPRRVARKSVRRQGKPSGENNAGQRAEGLLALNATALVVQGVQNQGEHLVLALLQLADVDVSQRGQHLQKGCREGWRGGVQAAENDLNRRCVCLRCVRCVRVCLCAFSSCGKRKKCDMIPNRGGSKTT